jgi:hypothetical protein
VIWPVPVQRMEHLIEDLVRPPGLHQTCLSNPDQQVPEGIRVEHVGVVDHDEGHRSVQPQFLAQLGQLVRCFSSAEVILPPVLAQILKLDSTMRAYRTERDLPRFQQPIRYGRDTFR